MPLEWRRGSNPYRVNYFGILQLGSQAQPNMIVATRKKIEQKIGSGASHEVAGQEIGKAEVLRAESRLLDDRRDWARESLLVHPVPTGDNARVKMLCSAIVEQATPPRAERPLRLTNLAALAPLVPRPKPEDLPWPEWSTLGIPGPDSPEDCRGDVQFDV